VEIALKKMHNKINPPKVVKVDSVDYKIEESIGCGGNADVYKCIDEASGNEYAIKFQRNIKVDRLNRFKREIILNKSIKHDHLIKYIGSGEYGRYPFIIMFVFIT
jgi:serine/threonine protein kinase